MTTTRRWSIAVALSAALALFGAAGEARGAISFVDESDLALEPDNSVEIKIFNGGKTRVTVHLTITGDAEGAVSVTPTAIVVVEGTVGFVSVMAERTTSGQLVAFASDGTIARRPIVPAERLPQSIDFAGTNGAPTPVANPNVDVPAQTFGTLAPDTPSETVGYVSSDSGDVASVNRKGNVLSVLGVDGAGEYSGTVTLSPSDKDGTPVSLRVRDAFYFALTALVLGLLIAAISEHWLSRLRPRMELETRLERLKERCADLHAKAEAEIRQHRDESGSHVQRIYADDADSLLKAEGDRLCEAQRNALSEAEREQWGPAGAELKAVEELEKSYGELVRQSVLIGISIGDLERSLSDDDERAVLNGSPVVERVDRLLASHVIRTSAELDEIARSGAATRQAGDAFVHLFSRLQHLERLAGTKNLHNLEAEALKMRRKLVRSFEGDEAELKKWDEDTDALEDKIATTSQAAHYIASVVAGAREEQDREDEVAAKARARSLDAAALTSTGDDPLPIVAGPRRANFIRRNLGWADLVFAFATWPIVVGAGLAVLYFNDAVWGSTGDYLAAFVWGSTAEIALTFIRRLLPTTFGGLRLG